MHIDQYRFGHIDIAGHGYDADVIIFPDHVQERWWRREGHRLAQEDLETVLAEKPDVLVVGTGNYGRMQVPAETLNALRSAGVDVRVEKTSVVVEEFNRRQRECTRTPCTSPVDADPTRQADGHPADRSPLFRDGNRTANASHWARGTGLLVDGQRD